MPKKFTLIKLFTFLGNLGIPIYAFVLYFSCLRTITGFLFFLFISSCIIERGWETFKTSKEKKKEELHGDWTLAAVTGSYLFLFTLFIGEFYLRVRTINISSSIIGLLLLALSFRLRFWGMAALGKQWAVHAVGAQKIKRVRLVKIGPYKYIRHPVYLGIMIEELSFPIIANASLSLLFVILVCLPLVVIRARMEEKTSLRRFGNKYMAYQKSIGMFFPTQLLKN